MKTKGINAETSDKALTERSRWLQDVITRIRSGKKLKGVKLTPLEWIEVSIAVGGFRPAPPPKPFLVQQRQHGMARQMEFTFDTPQAVAPVRKTRRSETSGKTDGAA